MIIACTVPAAFVLRSATHMLFYINSQCKQAHLFSDGQCIEKTLVILLISTSGRLLWIQIVLLAQTVQAAGLQEPPAEMPGSLG